MLILVKPGLMRMLMAR